MLSSNAIQVSTRHNHFCVNAINQTPVGAIMAFAGTQSNTPDGWLICDGSYVLAEQYVQLYLILGDAYGALLIQDGATLFPLPNLKQRFPMGAANAASVGATGGSAQVSLSESNLPSHTHTGTSNASGDHTHSGTTNTTGSHTHSSSASSASASSGGLLAGNVGGNVTATGFDSTGGEPNIYNTPVALTIYASGDHAHTLNVTSAGSHAHTFTTDATGSGTAIDIVNPFIEINYIIKC